MQAEYQTYHTMAAMAKIVVALLVAVAGAAPLEVNLNDPPESRWLGVLKHMVESGAGKNQHDFMHGDDSPYPQDYRTNVWHSIKDSIQEDLLKETTANCDYLQQAGFKVTKEDTLALFHHYKSSYKDIPEYCSALLAASPDSSFERKGSPDLNIEVTVKRDGKQVLPSSLHFPFDWLVCRDYLL